MGGGLGGLGGGDGLGGGLGGHGGLDGGLGGDGGLIHDRAYGGGGGGLPGEGDHGGEGAQVHHGGGGPDELGDGGGGGGGGGNGGGVAEARGSLSTMSDRADKSTENRVETELPTSSGTCAAKTGACCVSPRNEQSARTRGPQTVCRRAGWVQRARRQPRRAARWGPPGGKRTFEAVARLWSTAPIASPLQRRCDSRARRGAGLPVDAATQLHPSRPASSQQAAAERSEV